MATLFALGGSSIALGDDSSMNPFIGDSYRYFNGGRNVRDSAPSNRTVLGAVPADPARRRSHPDGLAERELQALSSSALAAWQRPIGSKSTASAAADLIDVAQSPSEGPAAVRVAGSSRPQMGIQGDAIR